MPPEKENLINAVELIIRRANNRAMDDVIHRLQHHGLDDEILQIIGQKNVSKMMQKLADGGNIDFELELSNATRRFIEKEVKKDIRLIAWRKRISKC